VAVLERFLEQTEAARFDADAWRARLRATSLGLEVLPVAASAARTAS
jgi:hypothetical protein